MCNKIKYILKNKKDIRKITWHYFCNITAGRPSLSKIKQQQLKQNKINKKAKAIMKKIDEFDYKKFKTLYSKRDQLKRQGTV